MSTPATLNDTKYRYLAVGEILQEGDEISFYGRDEWHPVHILIGGTVEDGDQGCFVFRRKGPNPGSGYRVLSPDETIQEGDEYFSLGGCWRITRDAGKEVRTGGGQFYRRAVPITPGPGYRLLTPDETIQEGDEYFSFSSDVRKTGESIGSKLGGASLTYRRKVAPSTDPGPGYRLLEPGERIQEGDEIRILKTGDEIPNSGGWKTVNLCCVNLSVSPIEVGFFRRKQTQVPGRPAIEPGVGYRPLALGETIQAGDEFEYEVGHWRPVDAAIGYTATGGDSNCFRRKVTETAVWAGDEIAHYRMREERDSARATVARHAESLVKLAERIVVVEQERDEARLYARNWEQIHFMAKVRAGKKIDELKGRISELSAALNPPAK